MKRTDNFFVIDNFNTIPIELIEYCNDYMIYNASTDPKITPALTALGLKFTQISRTGHNITTYFDFFNSNYDSLPDTICLTKGHMLGRHCSKSFFDRVYDNKYFTYLYEDKNTRNNMNTTVSFLTMENQYLEVNNSWYVHSPEHPHRFFTSFNDLLRFIYVDPVVPAYCSFAPGGCYIVPKEMVVKHSRAFYSNLNKIMNYGLNPNFPSEAHQIERMLPIIFESNYIENEWMNDPVLFDVLIEQRRIMIENQERKKQLCMYSKFKRIVKRLIRC